MHLLFSSSNLQFRKMSQAASCKSHDKQLHVIISLKVGLHFSEVFKYNVAAELQNRKC